MKRKIRVLHITPDDKFFDRVFTAWEKNDDFDNKALFFAPKKNYQFKYIKRTEVLEIYYCLKNIRERLLRDDFDMVFFHSMPAFFYKIVEWIPENKKIIWWGWGYDIYESQEGLPPIVKLDLFKTKTRVFVDKSGLRTFISRLKNLLGKKKAKCIQEAVLRRIDYYQPVAKFEMELLCQNKFFRAKEFYYKTIDPIIREFVERPADGNIILGNSATPSNNHLDVLDVIQSLRQKNQKIIMPLSYGHEKYKFWLKRYLQHPYIQPIYDFMPRDEYFHLVDKCSYAVYGTIRQQAMGNIRHDISQGIKVFLYKDSVAYQNFTNHGYVVFAIEDMTEKSLRTPITKEQMEQNNKARLSEYNRRMNVYHNCVEEMRAYLSKN